MVSVYEKKSIRGKYRDIRNELLSNILAGGKRQNVSLENGCLLVDWMDYPFYAVVKEYMHEKEVQKRLNCTFKLNYMVSDKLLRKVEYIANLLTDNGLEDYDADEKATISNYILGNLNHRGRYIDEDGVLTQELEKSNKRLEDVNLYINSPLLFLNRDYKGVFLETYGGYVQGVEDGLLSKKLADTLLDISEASQNEKTPLGAFVKKVKAKTSKVRLKAKQGLEELSLAWKREPAVVNVSKASIVKKEKEKTYDISNLSNLELGAVLEELHTLYRLVLEDVEERGKKFGYECQKENLYDVLRENDEAILQQLIGYEGASDKLKCDIILDWCDKNLSRRYMTLKLTDDLLLMLENIAIDCLRKKHGVDLVITPNLIDALYKHIGNGNLLEVKRFVYFDIDKRNESDRKEEYRQLISRGVETFQLSKEEVREDIQTVTDLLEDVSTNDLVVEEDVMSVGYEEMINKVIREVEEEFAEFSVQNIRRKCVAMVVHNKEFFEENITRLLDAGVEKDILKDYILTLLQEVNEKENGLANDVFVISTSIVVKEVKALATEYGKEFTNAELVKLIARFKRVSLEKGLDDKFLLHVNRSAFANKQRYIGIVQSILSICAQEVLGTNSNTLPKRILDWFISLADKVLVERGQKPLRQNEVAELMKLPEVVTAVRNAYGGGSSTENDFVQMLCKESLFIDDGKQFLRIVGSLRGEQKLKVSEENVRRMKRFAVEIDKLKNEEVFRLFDYKLMVTPYSRGSLMLVVRSKVNNADTFALSYNLFSVGTRVYTFQFDTTIEEKVFEVHDAYKETVKHPETTDTAKILHKLLMVYARCGDLRKVVKDKEGNHI